jgi:hypothetical protein
MELESLESAASLSNEEQNDGEENAYSIALPMS